MTRIAARVPDGLADELNAAATRLNCSRSEIVRWALELYLEEIDDLEEAARWLREPDGPPVDWEDVKRGLLASD